MPNRALLDPSNRLLGGATGDFSLYGALPAVTIGTASPARADPTLLNVPLSPPADPAAALRSSIEAPEDMQAAAPLAADPIPLAPPSATLNDVHAPAAAAQALAAQVAAPAGSGSLAPIVADTTLPLVHQGDAADGAAPLTHGLGSASLAAPVLDSTTSAPAQATALAPAITALATPALDVLAASAGTISSTAPAAIDTATLLDGVAHDANLPAVEATVGAVSAALPDVPPAPGAGAVADVAAAAVDTLADVHASAVDTLADVHATTADLSPALAPALADAHLGGSDPAGGVTTLVSMVETAAVFEVGQASAEPDAAPAGGSIIDALAADEAPPALLGDLAHAPDDLLPHHDDGVPGLL